MPSAFVKAMSQHNICTYYLLPLIQLNKVSFGDGNFVDSYVTQDGNTLIVEVRDIRLTASQKTHPHYLREAVGSPHDFFYYELPSRWRADFELFCKGKYSKFSDCAKEMIYAFSGLAYNEPGENGKVITDARLRALTLDPVLRETWELELGLYERGGEPISEDMELVSIPSDKCFRTI